MGGSQTRVAPIDMATDSRYERIRASLLSVRRRQETTDLARGLALAGSALVVIVVLAAVVEAAARLDIGGRTVLFLVSASLATAAFAVFAGPPLLRAAGITRRLTEDDVALRIGLTFPAVKDRLLNAIQVYREHMLPNRPAYSTALVEASFRELAEQCSSLDLASVVDPAPARRAGWRFAALAGFAVILTAIFPGTVGGGLSRLLHFRTEYVVPAPFTFTVLPGDREAVKGERIVLTARTSLGPKSAVSIFLREEQQTDFDLAETRRDSAGKAVAVIPSLRSTIVYYAEAEGFRSRTYTIRMVDRPFVRSMRLELAFPRYTGLPNRVLDENEGDVSALPGTRVTFTITANKELASATLVLDDSEQVPLHVNGERAGGTIVLKRDRRYRIELTDPGGLGNVNPITYALRTTPDMPPTVRILEPPVQVDLDETMRLPLMARIGDDYGFSRLLLHYRIASSRYEKAHESFTAVVVPLPVERKREMDVPYLWNLASLGLVPEDVVDYYLEVFDNDDVNGPKSARSRVHTVRLPSMEEVFARVDRRHEQAGTDLQRALSAAEDVKKQVERIQREMKQQNTQKLDWQQKRALEEALKRQEKILEDIKSAKEQLEKLSSELQKQNIVSEETLEKYRELKELLEQIDAPQLREAMKRMNEAMKQMTPEQVKEALERFRFNEDVLRRSIERTIELLKRLQIEQKTDELTRRAEELARKQEELARRTEQADSNNQEELDRLAREQRELRQEAEAMQRELDELRRRMEEFPQDMPLGEMQEAQSELNLGEMQQSMSEAAGQCQGGSCSTASRGQKKIAEQMRRFQQKMQKVRKKLNENQQRMVMQMLKRALDNVLDLSQRQERLRDETRTLPPNSQRFREMQQKQTDLAEQLAATANELMELSKKSFAVTPEMGQRLGEAFQKMQESLRDMRDRNAQGAGEQQSGAMAALNEAAKEIAQGMQASSSCSGQGGSLMMQLQQLAQRQMSLNMGTEQLMRQGLMTQQQLAQLQRLTQEQAALQKTLEQLNEEARRSEEGNRLLGDLQRIAEEMQEVVRDMQGNEVNPNTLQKQERILSRLLDASRSMRERDWEKRRRAETGRDVVRRSPSDIDPDALETESGFRDDLRKAVEEGYTRDYENLIRRYFEALGKVVGGSTP